MYGEKLEITPFSEVFAYYLFLTESDPGLPVTAGLLSVSLNPACYSQYVEGILIIS